MSDNVITFPITFLKISDLVKITSVKKPTIYRLIKSGDFPKPVKIGTSSRWPAHEVHEWMQARMAAREEAA